MNARRTKTGDSAMNEQGYRRAIGKIGLSQIETALFLGVGDRTSRRWAAGYQIPQDVATLLALMAKYNMHPEEARRLIDLPWPDSDKWENLALDMLLEVIHKYNIHPLEAREAAK